MRAAREAIRFHKLMGYSMPVWQDGEVVWLEPDEIEIPEIDESQYTGTTRAQQQPLESQAEPPCDA